MRDKLGSTINSGTGAENNKAAMYVRMSTDHQKYSTENQADAIKKYAKERKLEIIETYADEGKSGLSFSGRKALQKLINDVRNGDAKFSVILVLDITRWGRFQDADQSAYYEYICRRSGVNVQYVGEQFENDGSPGSTIIKSVKRAMAGEYSRELSNKVFAGQCRLIELGYRQGGPAGFGIRRMLVDEHGRPKVQLNPGEQKSLQTDRVILVPGPQEETEIVQWIYKVFIEDGASEANIAEQLNKRKIRTDLDREWTSGVVRQILTNEKYIGNNVFNRTSNKLKKRHVTNPEEMWVRADGAFEPIVATDLFYTARGIINERNRRVSNEEMLGKLKGLHERKGWLSGIVIDEQNDMPSSSLYRSRFGSLLRAYKLVGYTPNHDYQYIEINRFLRQLHSTTVEATIEKIRELGVAVDVHEDSGLLHISNELKVSIVICRCLQTKAGSFRWQMRFDTGLKPDITISVRMSSDNQTPLDYYLLPMADIQGHKVRLSENNGLAFDAFRFNDLDHFYKLTERVNVSEAA